MKPFAERIREDRRLVILRLLAEQPGYTINSSTLLVGLRHLGLACTRADVIDDLDRLATEALVRVERIEVGSLSVATLLARGLEVVSGELVVPGVARPSPK